MGERKAKTKKNSVEEIKEVAKREAEKISESAEINESYFVGILWSDPYNNYSSYYDNIEEEEFIHPQWGFFYDLGKRMYGEGVKTFDTITVHTKVKEYGLTDLFKEYGGLKTPKDAIDIVKDYSDNVEYYYETIKKNFTIRELVDLFGHKVLINKNKYNYKEMTREQLTTYWHDKLNKIALNNVSNYEAKNLVISYEDFMSRLEEDSAEMLPYYRSKLLNQISQGVARGHVTMIGGFGNTGKSSFTAEKFVMSCLENGEKLLVILNEEDDQAFRQKIVLSILYHEIKKGIDRRKFVNGGLEEEDKELIKKAIDKMNELTNGDKAQIKLVFMQKYVMRDLEKIVNFWANRGYINLLIDTHKVSDDSQYDARWETFVEDMKTIYRLTRKDAGGKNLRTVVTFQLADSAIKFRYLTFDSMAEGKAAKNEASTVYMFRPAFDSEYEGGKKELDCYRFKKVGSKYIKQNFTLDREKTYYLLFTPKNRTGNNNDNGQAILVLEAALHMNHFEEVGWCSVPKDHA